MITYRKIGPDQWGIQSEGRLEPGTTVTVNLKSGATKSVVVGPFVIHQYDRFVYQVGETKKEERERVAVGSLAGRNIEFGVAMTSTSRLAAAKNPWVRATIKAASALKTLTSKESAMRSRPQISFSSY